MRRRRGRGDPFYRPGLARTGAAARAPHPAAPMPERGMRLHTRICKAMGGPCELRLYAPDAACAERCSGAAQAEILRLEQRYSRYREDSLTTRITRSAGDGRGVEVEEEDAALLDYAHTAWAQSGGLFD